MILRAAQGIVDKQGFAGLTMNAVARRCDLAKATLYGYFQTREELLLEVLKLEFSAWFLEFHYYLADAENPFDDSFVDMWISSFLQQPRLLSGLVHWHAVLQPHLDADLLSGWKSFLSVQIQETHYKILAQFQPNIPLSLLADFLSTLTTLTWSFWVVTRSPQSRGQDPLEQNFQEPLKRLIEASLTQRHYAPLRKLKVL